MKFAQLLGVAVAAFAGHATAFWGQMAASDYINFDGGIQEQYIYLTDYNTGSTYKGVLVGGFNACAATDECSVYFWETSAGGYSFNAWMWRTADGCHNIDFNGGLDAHHGYCCGSLPCDFSA